MEKRQGLSEKQEEFCRLLAEGKTTGEAERLIGFSKGYGADSGEAALQEMLYPGEYMRLLEAVKDINGFRSRRRVWKEQAKK